MTMISIVYLVLVLIRNSFYKLTPDLEGHQISSARCIILIKGRQLFPPDRDIVSKYHSKKRTDVQNN